MRSSEFITEDESKFTGIIPTIKYMMPEDLTPSEDLTTQQQSVNWWLEDHPDKTKEDWARYWLKKGDAVPAVWFRSNGWKITIHDGHHRLLASTILNVPVRVDIEAYDIPTQWINSYIEGCKDTGFDCLTGEH